MLPISELAPDRSTIAVRESPPVVMACRNPCAIERTPTNTTTTPAMPSTETAEAPKRCGTLRRFSAVTALI